jgi:hypothetical protein
MDEPRNSSWNYHDVRQRFAKFDTMISSDWRPASGGRGRSGLWAHDYLQQYGNLNAAGTEDIQRNTNGEQIFGLLADIMRYETNE